MVLLTACATEKEVVRTRPVAAINQPEEPLAEEKTAAAPAPEAEAKAKAKAADGASANKGKEAKRQPAKGKQASADEGDEYGDDDSDALDNSNIFFQYASHELSPASKRELARVAAILKRNKSARVTLSGHTCDKSSLSVNMRLSQKRAEAASGYLQQLGVSAGRISIEAHGYNQPLAPNTSERNRAKNRRVEVTVEE